MVTSSQPAELQIKCRGVHMLIRTVMARGWLRRSSLHRSAELLRTVRRSRGRVVYFQRAFANAYA